MKRTSLIILYVTLYLSANAFADSPSWHTSLFFSNGGIWETRIPIDFENRGTTEMAGFPIAVPLPGMWSSGRDDRVVRSGGQEVIYGTGWQLGQEVEGGGRSVDTVLYVPVDAKPGESVRYYLYTNRGTTDFRYNRLPEQEKLDFKAGIENGGFEATGMDKGEPDSWKFDEQDATHRLFWSDENPHSGVRCIKTVVAEGAEPTWISARQDRILIRPGAKYRFSGWVKGENVNGISGWYIHVGPDGEPFTISPMATTNENTFAWKKVEVEFTAPQNALVADVGTVLRGTGTAWFDDVQLELLDESEAAVAVTVGNYEQCPLKVYPDSDNFRGWSSGDSHSHPTGYECRSTFLIINDSDATINKPSVMFDLRASFAHGRIGLPTDILVQDSLRARVPGQLIDPIQRQAMATLSAIPPRSINYIHVYYHIDEQSEFVASQTTLRGEESTAHPDLQRQRDPYEGFDNLVQNGGFETLRNGRAVAWQGDSRLETDPAIVRFGETCARIDMTEQDAGNWRGFRQTVPVIGGRAYLVSAWLRCQDMPGGARVHIHFHKQDGSFTASQSMTSLDKEIRGTTDWTHCAQVIATPPDAASMVIHLTANQPGTLWHDNITVLDSIMAEFVEAKSFYPPPLSWFPQGLSPEEIRALREEQEARYANPVSAWQVPAVMKVFPQSLPPQSVIIDANNKGELVARISAARNEKEPLQLAVRSFTPLIAKVSDLLDANGNTLPPPEIAVVGYVPIDWPSNYYNDTAPKWHRKNPRSSPGCDGWPGLWPDPLIPGNMIDRMRHNTGGTDAFWLTWSIPKDAVAGVYRGTISFSYNEPKQTHEQPFAMPVEVTVYDFTLPDAGGVSATYDARFTGPAGIWGRDIYRRAVETMAANRLEPDDVQPAPRVSFRNGRFTFDWTEFDKAAAHLFDDLHVKFVYTPQLFYLFGWGHPPKDFYGEKPYDGEWPFNNADRRILRPEYKQRYQAALREFWNHVKEKGWADRFVLYISDEPNFWEEPVKQQMIALCEMIHEVDPAIPIYSSTWNHVPEWDDAIDVWGISHYGLVPPDKMREITERGARLWFTTDGMMCLDTPYCAIERLLPHYCFKYGAEAYEFWGIGWLTYDPWDYGFHSYIRQSSIPGEYYYVRYPNGDGYLLYPDMPRQTVTGIDGITGEAHETVIEPGFFAGEGRMITSVRFEQAREGVEDYEYLRLLRSRIDKSEAAEPGNAKAASAQAVLEEAMSLIDCPTDIGRYSTRILPDPKRLETLRDQIARAIESL
ncbi:MAG: carbohydrate binding domain-containing protein [Planctomycetaceae bacterium]|nr:carbohydrate binding domain-containing protein [Planctomycetaceae bacterium]